MPVTAKLSRQFYEKLGDQIANELVEWLNAVDESVRGQLLELNERNWDRLRAELGARDARFDARLASMETQTNSRFVELAAQFDSRLVQMGAHVESRIGGVETRLMRWMVGLWLTSVLTTVLAMLGLKLL